MEKVVEHARRLRWDVRNSGRAHYLAAERALRTHKLLGAPAIVLSSIVGTSIFATVNSSPAIGWKIAAGLIAILAAVFTALQSFFKLSETAETHRAAGAEYGALRRRLDLFLIRIAESKNYEVDQALSELDQIHKAMRALALQSATVPPWAYQKARQSAAGQDGTASGQGAAPNGQPPGSDHPVVIEDHPSSLRKPTDP
jgi:hypothetical protein